MNFTFNGNTPKSILYNGNDLKELQFNGNTVWRKIVSDLQQSCWFGTSSYSATPNGLNAISSPLNGYSINEAYSYFGCVCRMNAAKFIESKQLKIGAWFKSDYSGSGGSKTIQIATAQPGAITDFSTLKSGSVMGGRYFDGIPVFSSQDITISGNDISEQYVELVINNSYYDMYQALGYIDIIFTETSIQNRWEINTDKNSEKCVTLL